MRYLSDIVQDAQTKVFDTYGVFFAFTQEQLNERKKEGVTYVSVGSGMIVPKENVQAVKDALNKVWDEGIKTDIELHGKHKIILRELCNYECFYTGDIEDAIAPLKDYGYTRDDILEVYRQEYEAHA